MYITYTKGTTFTFIKTMQIWTNFNNSFTITFRGELQKKLKYHRTLQICCCTTLQNLNAEYTACNWVGFVNYRMKSQPGCIRIFTQRQFQSNGHNYVCHVVWSIFRLSYSSMKQSYTCELRSLSEVSYKSTSLKYCIQLHDVKGAEKIIINEPLLWIIHDIL